MQTLQTVGKGRNFILKTTSINYVLKICVVNIDRIFFNFKYYKGVSVKDSNTSTPTFLTVTEYIRVRRTDYDIVDFRSQPCFSIKKKQCTNNYLKDHLYSNLILVYLFLKFFLLQLLYLLK